MTHKNPCPYCGRKPHRKRKKTIKWKPIPKPKPEKKVEPKKRRMFEEVLRFPVQQFFRGKRK